MFIFIIYFITFFNLEMLIIFQYGYPAFYKRSLYPVNGWYNIIYDFIL